MMDNDFQFCQIASTTLCLIREGVTDPVDLRHRLGLEPIPVMDLLDGLQHHHLVFWIDGRLALTMAGCRAVSHIQLVQNGSDDRILKRWSPIGPAGDKRVA